MITFDSLGSLILILTITIPLLGIISLLFIKEENLSLLKIIGLNSSLLAFITSLFLWFLFDKSATGFQFIITFNHIPFSNIEISLGLDGISLFFVLLTTFLIPVCILIGWDRVKTNFKIYLILFLTLEILVIIVFSVLDLLIFYIFFESVLIPIFLIIGIFGSRERKIHAAYQFFLYTLIGSVFILLAIIIIYLQVGTTDLSILIQTNFTKNQQLILWLAFFFSFAVKIPIIPFHIWLPEAHVEAPTAGSVILAGILLKLGGYGLLRFSIPLFPDATIYYTPLVYTMSVIAVIYTSLTTLRQIDLKKIIAYSSVAHINFVTIGLFTLNIQGVEGAILLILSHGFVSSALFLCVGVLYDRHKTRILEYYSGIAYLIPVFAIFFLFFIIANLSLPGTSSFVGEFLVLLGVCQHNLIVTFLATTGIILGAAYSVWLYNRVIFGPLKSEQNLTIPIYHDINRREFIYFLPFVFIVLWIGIYPDSFLNVIHISVSSLLDVSFK